MSDKVERRSPVTDATATIGTIIDENAKRDAIHIAVEPVIAGTVLYPGQPVRLVDGGRKAINATFDDSVGITDPFLRNPAYPGERFWLVLHPRTITSLRHVWEHPDFDNEDKEEIRATTPYQNAVDEMIDLCESWDGPGWATVKGFLESNDNDYYNDRSYTGMSISDEYLRVSGTDAYGPVPERFWELAEIITGRNIRPRGTGDDEAVYFTCSC